MLEEAQYTITGFIKGPVCRGQVALNVINDLFWVVFVDPELERSELSAKSSLRAGEDPLARRGRRLASADQVEEIRGIRERLSEGEVRRAQPRVRRQAAARSRDTLGRRRQERERGTHDLPSLRQRHGRAGPRRRDAADRLGRRLCAAGAHPLPAGGGLRRVRQRRPPGHDAHVHGFPAHGGRSELLTLLPMARATPCATTGIGASATT